MEVEGAWIEPEEPPIHVQREEEEGREDLGREIPEPRGVEEIPPGPVGQEVPQVVEVVMDPPEAEDRGVEQPGSRGERPGAPRFGPGDGGGGCYGSRRPARAA